MSCIVYPWLVLMTALLPQPALPLPTPTSPRLRVNPIKLSTNSLRDSRRQKWRARISGFRRNPSLEFIPYLGPKPPHTLAPHYAREGRREKVFSTSQCQETGNAAVDLKGLRIHEMEEWARSHVGLGSEKDTEKFARRLWGFLHGEGRFITSWEQACKEYHVNGFSRKFVDRMKQEGYSLRGGLELSEISESVDGTRKFIFDVLNHEHGRIEAVSIPMERTLNSGRRKRMTICVSSQVGCAMGCDFCYTGLMGLRKNLTAAQIVEQVLTVRRSLPMSAGHPQATNVVFMGMGEPFHNLDEVVKAINILTTPGPNTRHFAPDRITVSTVGLVPEIRRFRRESRAHLAVSLHATTDSVRSAIMPVNRRYNLSTLMATLEELFPSGGSDSVMIEYLLLKGINDSPQDAQRLVEMSSKLKCIVNLIEFNPHSTSHFSRSPRETTEAFAKVLRTANQPMSVRLSRGDEGMAACGQLGNPFQDAVKKKSRRQFD